MEKLLLTLPRSEGDVLVRMKKEYEDTAVDSVSFKTILAPKGFAKLLSRFGVPYSAKEVEGIAEVAPSLELSAIDSSELPPSSYIPDNALMNQMESKIEKVDDDHYTVTTNFKDIEKYVLNFEDRAKYGECYWLAIGVATGEESIIGFSVNGVALTDTDVYEATQLELPEGSFALWIKLEDKETNVLIEKEGKTAIINIKVVPAEE